MVLLTGCSAQQPEPPAHQCSTPCADCGLCGDANCQDPSCAEKCSCSHVCGHACPDCGMCLDPDCQDEICVRKCTADHTPVDVPAEESAAMETAVPQEDFITTEAISLDMGTFVYDIGPGIWVPRHICQTAETVAAAMEKVSGLSFEGDSRYSRDGYPDGKVHVTASRDLLYVNEDWYKGLDTSEFGGAYSSAYGHVVLSSGDILGHGNALTHELGHVLSFRQTPWYFCRVLSEGFAEYTSYLAALEASATDPAWGYYLGDPREILRNNSIDSYKELYKHPMEYWFENEFAHAGNGNYTVGFRFMAYLQDVYGDYSRWITEFENTYCFQTREQQDDVADPLLIIEVLKAAYSPDVLDNFYPWLKDHAKELEEDEKAYRDLSGTEELDLYPAFNAITSSTMLERFQYQDLTIHLEPAKAYLEQYKDVDISDARIKLSGPVQIELLDGQGELIAAEKTDTLPLEGVSSIRLTGSGKLAYFKIIGYENCG